MWLGGRSTCRWLTRLLAAFFAQLLSDEAHVVVVELDQTVTQVVLENSANFGLRDVV